jgi:hypothetical protein
MSNQFGCRQTRAISCRFLAWGSLVHIRGITDNTRAKPTKPKLEGKILRALKAWHVTTYSMTIWNTWRASGLSVVTIHQVPFYMTVDQGKVRELVLRHCPDGEEFIARVVQAQ